MEITIPMDINPSPGDVITHKITGRVVAVEFDPIRHERPLVTLDISTTEVHPLDPRVRGLDLPVGQMGTGGTSG